ncbi:hypothetical protein CASFOL_003369 [Castilleja foliolosa]|uniref:Homeobox-leucine zipper protein n=1 Tax=Castilleja foliolosa TaxID=1961234 RepID=A0ABD3EHA0_9LAMI
MESPNNSSNPQKNNDEIKKSSKSSKRKNNNKSNIIAKRFSDEQIKSLESTFKLETKLEPKKKLQLASDLGLQPRQVAIWFQNKRARWKSKQIEQEYKDLRANYDSLYMQFDDLKREKLFLQTQLKELSDVVKNEDEEFKEYHSSSNGEMDHHNDVMKIDDHENNNIIAEDFEKTDHKAELVSWDEEEEIISHLASPEKWCDFPSGGLFDRSSGASSWWES